MGTFLTSLIIKKTFRQDLKIVDENREKESGYLKNQQSYF